MDGLYSSLSGAMNLETRLRVVAHDLANINTPGHKRTRMTEASEYPVVLSDLIHRSDPREFDTAAPEAASEGDLIYNRPLSSAVDFSQGALRLTGAATDFALDGPGFFAVEVDGVERYTRAGAFELDARGQLSMRVDGRFVPVLGDTGPVTVTSAQFTVGSDGTVHGADGAVVGRLRTVQADQPQRLERIGSTLFADAAGQAGVRPSLQGETLIRQGALEQSNGDPVSSLVEMIEIQRAYQAVSKAMTTADEATGRRITTSLNA